MVDFEKKSEDGNDAVFGQPFDYDPTAEASLSEQPGTSESVPPHGSTPSSGPGWDTYAGVGNGPGWSDMPSYPAPVDTPQPSVSQPTVSQPSVSPTPAENYPLPGYPTGEQPTQAFPNYGDNPTSSPTPEGYQGPPYGQNPYQQNPPYPYGAGQYPQAHYPQAQYPQAQNPQAQYPPQQQTPYYQQPYYPQQGVPQPGYGAPSYFANSGVDAPFGRDPITGEPLSDKSKIVAGLLQIFLGGFGAGRFYIGSNGIAVAQLILLILGWLTVVLGVGALILMGLGIWVLVDGIMMLVGNVKDSSGRRLRS